MLISQVLLTFFLIQWVWGHYSTEKNFLHKDISNRFEDAKREAMDSAIYKKYVLPYSKMDTLYEKKEGGSHITISSGFTFTSDSTDLPHPGVIQNSNRTVIKLQVKDSLKKKSLNAHVQEFDKTKQMVSEMIYGIRLMTNGSLQHGDWTFDLGHTVDTDTTLLKQLFLAKMSEYPFIYEWSSKLNSFPHPFYFFIEIKNKKNFGVWINGTTFFLFKKTLYPILWAVLLLLLTGLAFFLSYRSIRSQQRLNIAREEFISNISHELKTPLATTKITVEALKTYDERKRNEVLLEYLDIAWHELNRLDGLVNQVLNTSAMEDKNTGLQLSKSNLGELVEQCVKSFQVRLKDSNATIELGHIDSTEVNIDPLHIQGVILNLLDNAYKYNTHPKPLIKIEMRKENHLLNIFVSDNGPGIAKEYREKVFDKFFRVPTFNKHNVKGHGLGLAYAKSVMQKHNGKIEVQNNENGGCTFTLIFNLI